MDGGGAGKGESKMTSKTYTKADGSTITLSAKEEAAVRSAADQLGITWERALAQLTRKKDSYGGRV